MGKRKTHEAVVIQQSSVPIYIQYPVAVNTFYWFRKVCPYTGMRFVCGQLVSEEDIKANAEALQIFNSERCNKIISSIMVSVSNGSKVSLTDFVQRGWQIVNILQKQMELYRSMNYEHLQVACTTLCALASTYCKYIVLQDNFEEDIEADPMIVVDALDACLNNV